MAPQNEREKGMLDIQLQKAITSSIRTDLSDLSPMRVVNTSSSLLGSDYHKIKDEVR